MKENLTPIVSFVILEYYSLAEITESVKSIIELCKNINYEIIISSNSSYSEHLYSAIELHPAIKWIFNDKNNGFASGMNSGLNHTQGQFIIFMNSDAQLHSGSMEETIKYLNNNPDVGILGPKITDHLDNLQDSCREFLTPMRLLKRMITRFLHKQDSILTPSFDYNQIQPVDWVIGAFMMVRKSVIEKIGRMDESYFLYVEDMDWCKRCWDKGFKVIYYPELKIIFKGDRKSLSALKDQKISNKFLSYHIKSYLHFLRKFGANPKR
jgi:hypothetical protein